MSKVTEYYNYIQNIGYKVDIIKDEQDIVLLVDVLSIEFVPEPLRCFKSFDGITMIGYFLGTLKELGYEVTYEEAKRICEVAKRRAKLKKKLLIKESLEL